MTNDTEPDVSNHPGADAEAQHKEIEIIVNTKTKTVPSREVTYDEVVALANLGPSTPDTMYTVYYENAVKPNHEGSLAKGGVVTVKEKGTSFDVTKTNKS